MAKLYVQFLTGVQFHLSVILYVKESEWFNNKKSIWVIRKVVTIAYKSSRS